MQASNFARNDWKHVTDKIVLKNKIKHIWCYILQNCLKLFFIQAENRIQKQGKT